MINPVRITLLRELVRGARKFVEQVYVPDVLAVAGFYKDWFALGEGRGQFPLVRRLFVRQPERPEHVSVPAEESSWAAI